MECVPSANAIRSLVYAMVDTQPDISHAVGILSRYMATPRKEHWIVFKRFFRYFSDTTYFEIFYHENSEEVEVQSFIDSDWAGDINNRWSISGYVFRLFGGSIHWMSRKQYVVDLSTTETKYIAAT